MVIGALDKGWSYKLSIPEQCLGLVVEYSGIEIVEGRRVLCFDYRVGENLYKLSVLEGDMLRLDGENIFARDSFGRDLEAVLGQFVGTEVEGA